MRFLLKDSSGKKSITVTAFVIGFVVATAKFAASELIIKGFTFPAFSGGDYAAACAALGAIYVLRRANIGGSNE